MCHSNPHFYKSKHWKYKIPWTLFCNSGKLSNFLSVNCCITFWGIFFYNRKLKNLNYLPWKCMWLSPPVWIWPGCHFLSYHVSSVIWRSQDPICHLSTRTSQSNKAARSNHWIKSTLFAEIDVRGVNIHGHVTMGMLNRRVAECAEAECGCAC